MSPRSPRGVALLLVAGVLSVIAVLGVTFVVLSGLERQAASRRVQASRAVLLARSGLEEVTARLDCGQDPEDPAAAFAGEDWDGDGMLGPLEAAAEVHHPGALDREACPLRHALRPSFHARAGGNPALAVVEGRPRGYSGRLGSGAYALRVASGGGFYVNGGDPAAPPVAGYNAVLMRLLGTLAEAMDREDGLDDGLPVNGTDGAALVRARPAGGWRDWESVRDLALGGSQAKLDALKPSLALEAWVDLKVAAPNPVSLSLPAVVHSWGEIRQARASGLGGSLAPDFERLNGQVVGRAPVDLSWARRRRPALIALLADLEGIYLDIDAATGTSYQQSSWSSGTYSTWETLSDVLGTMRSASLALDWAQPTDDCRATADRLLASGAPLDSWQGWNVFCDALPMTGTTAEAQAKRDILKANFNPNTDLNKFNPDPTLWRSVDKQDLRVYSTEFILQPVRGIEVESEGRVLDAGGRVLAAARLKARFAPSGVIRLTTQREFHAEDLGDPGRAGDESDLRLPGYRAAGAAPFLSESRGTARTWGHRLGMGGVYPGTWMDGDSGGLGLQTYPEACVDAGSGLSIGPADYDGRLQLATLETATDDRYVPEPGQMMMLARFDTAWDLDVFRGVDGACVPDVQQVTRSELDHGLMHPAKFGTLHPDGAYSEWERAPSFPDKGNASGFHGVISFWVKPNYADIVQQPGWVQKARGRCLVYAMNANAGSGTWYDHTHFFSIGDYRHWALGGNMLAEARGYAAWIESGHWSSDTAKEFCPKSPPLAAGGRGWRLLTLGWDLKAPTANEIGEMVVNGGGPGEVGSTVWYMPSSSPGSAQDLTQNDYWGAHRLWLGMRHFGIDPNFEGNQWLWYNGRGADSTYDEFAIYDLGGSDFDPVSGTSTACLPDTVPATLADNRHAEGRYYKGAVHQPVDLTSTPVPDEAAAWFSAPIPLPPGSFIQRIGWAWYRPAALPDDYAEIELVDLPGTGYLWLPIESRSTSAGGWSADRADWKVGRSAPAPFRIRAVFRRVTPLDPDQPILDSPVLDDLTVVYRPATGPACSMWGTD